MSHYPNWEVIDKTGKTIISLGARHAVGHFFGGLASVSTDHGSGVIDRTDRLVIPIRYSYADSLGEGYALAGGSSEGGMAIFDRPGKQLTPLRFSLVHPFNRGLAPAADLGGENHLYGYVDPTGAWIIPPQFSEAYSFSGDLARVVLKSGEVGYVSRSGKVICSRGHLTPCRYI